MKTLASLSALAILAAAVLLAPMSCSGGRSLDLEGWNCLLITLDTTRQDRLGSYGYENARTPKLDELAAGGITFDQAEAVAPTTLPSHASILTGTYPPFHGVRGNAFYSLPEERITFTEILSDAGYETAAVMAALVLGRRYGLAQGFDVYDDDPDAMTQDLQFDPARPGHEVTKAAFRSAAQFSRAAPWFLWVHYYDPHLPRTPRPDFTPLGADPTDDSIGYDAEVSYLDRCIEILLDEFDNQGLLEKTLIVVVADHGEGFAGPHVEKTHGSFVYHDTQRIPMILHAAGAIEGGQRSETLVSQVDIAPTVLDLLGFEAGDEMQGESLRDILETGRTTRRPVAYMETMLPWEAYGWSPLFSVRDSRWKYIEGPYDELYDLERDPDELDNVVAAHPQRAAEMKATLQALKQETGGGAVSGGPQDAEELERLRELGYVAAGASPSSDLPPLAELRHPLELYHIVEELDVVTTLEAMGQNRAAIRKLVEIQEEDPHNYDVLRRLAQIRMKEGDWHPATDAAKRLLEIRPDLPHSYYLLADVLSAHSRSLIRIGRPGESQEKLDEAIRALRSIPQPELLGAGPATRLGLLYLDAGRPQEALASFEEAIRIAPASYTANREAGEILLARSEAINDQDRARQHLDDARRYFEAAVEASETHPERLKPLLIRLLSIYRKLDMKEEIRGTARSFLKRFPDDPAAQVARHALERLEKP